MILRRMSIAELWGVVMEHIHKRTDIKVFSAPDNEPAPFYVVDVPSMEPNNNKTMFKDVFTFEIHAISVPTNPFSYEPVLKLVKKLEEAMTEEIELPSPFVLVAQTYQGLGLITKEESEEGHAILTYSFDIAYGLKCK